MKAPVIWALVEALVSLASSLIVGIVTGKIIGVHAFGVASIAFFIGSLAETIVSLPFSEAIIRRRFFSLALVDAAYTASTIIGASIFIILACAAPMIAHMYGEAELTLLIILQSTTCLLFGIRAVPEAVLARKLRFKALSIRSVAAKLIGAAVTIGLALGGAGSWSLIVGNVAFALVATVMVYRATKRRPRYSRHLSLVSELLVFGKYTVLEAFIGAATPRIFGTMMGYYHGVRAAGETAIALRMNDAIGGVVSAMSVRMALPLLTRYAEYRDQLLDAAFAGTRFTFLFAVAAFGGLMLTSRDIVLFVLGPAWDHAATALVAVNCFSLFNFAMVLTGPVLKAIGRPGRWLFVPAGSGLFVIAGSFAVSGYRMEAQLMVWGLFGIVNFLLSFFALRSVTGVTARQVVTPLFPGVAAFAAMAASIQCAALITDSRPGLEALLIKVPVGGLAFLAVAMLLAGKDIRNMAGR